MQGVLLNTSKGANVEILRGYFCFFVSLATNLKYIIRGRKLGKFVK